MKKPGMFRSWPDALLTLGFVVAFGLWLWAGFWIVLTD
jgi:hypothetical protein